MIEFIIPIILGIIIFITVYLNMNPKPKTQKDCVGKYSLGVNTVIEGENCLPNYDIICDNGTKLDENENVCKPDYDAICDNGTKLENNKCVVESD